jgi:hypothetical protein
MNIHSIPPISPQKKVRVIERKRNFSFTSANPEKALKKQKYISARRKWAKIWTAIKRK